MKDNEKMNRYAMKIADSTGKKKKKKKKRL
jgi:hypothetical protein